MNGLSHQATAERWENRRECTSAGSQQHTIKGLEVFNESFGALVVLCVLHSLTAYIIAQHGPLKRRLLYWSPYEYLAGRKAGIQCLVGWGGGAAF